MLLQEWFLSNNNTAPAVVVNTSDKVLFWNTAAFELFGISPTKALGKYFFEAIDKLNGRQISIKVVMPLLDEQHKIVARLIVLAKNGGIPEDQSFTLHQMNAPLAAIKWSVEMLLEEDLTAHAKAKIVDVQKSVQALIGLVDDLLGLARITAGKLTLRLTAVNTREFFEKILSAYRPLIECNKQTMRVDLSECASIIRIDPILLTHAIGNVLENAINYAPKGSEIQFWVSCGENSCTVATKNFGPVIPPDEMSRLFTKFFRGEAAKKIKPFGSGLGLFIARSIVEEHGGQIRVESDEERGTIFFITIPIGFEAVKYQPH